MLAAAAEDEAEVTENPSPRKAANKFAPVVSKVKDVIRSLTGKTARNSTPTATATDDTATAEEDETANTGADSEPPADADSSDSDATDAGESDAAA